MATGWSSVVQMVRGGYRVGISVVQMGPYGAIGWASGWSSVVQCGPDGLQRKLSVSKNDQNCQAGQSKPPPPPLFSALQYCAVYAIIVVFF